MAKQERLREAKQHGAAWFPFNIYPCTIPKDFPQVALHWQDSLELVFVKKGRGIVQAGLTTYTAQAGDIYSGTADTYPPGANTPPSLIRTSRPYAS